MQTPPSRKKLPVNPSLEHLKKQAKRRAKQDPALPLTTAQHQLAQEYGCKNWAELAHLVATQARSQDGKTDPDGRYQAMPKAARAGDFELLRRLLEEGTFTQHNLDQSLAHVLWYGKASTWPARKAAADLLLGYGADPDAEYGSNYGPIVFGTGECIQPEGLLYLLEAGADVSFAPIKTKYGLQCPLSYILGSYGRGANERKHRYIDLLLAHRPFVPPEVTPPILAIHRGAATELGEMIERDPLLLTLTFPRMPYGNIALHGGTLLHCAVEFNENECVTELLKRGANINAQAEVIEGIGGQTAVFHAIPPPRDQNFSTLEHLIREAGSKIDWSIRATFRRYGEIHTPPMTPLEFAEEAARKAEAEGRPESAREIALLRSLGSR